MKKKNICVDFDGVMNTYTHWQGEDYLYDIREGCYEFIKNLSENYNVIIFTTRKRKCVLDWLNKHNLEEYIQDVTDKKLPAEVYIDDRALRFNGDYENTLAQIGELKPYWK